MEAHIVLALLFFSLSNIVQAQHKSMDNATIMIPEDIRDKEISAAFPFAAKYEQVFGSNMHYVDEGDPTSEHTFLLIHGNPTSSYLWRNIIPYLSPLGRVVVPDLIGMGKSDKPDIGYTFEEHIEYINTFIDQLDLDNIILVVHDWGSGIGFNYANTHRDKVSGIVFMEAVVRPYKWKDATLLERYLFKRMRHPEKGYKMVVEKNFFLKRLMPMMTKRKLTQEEKDYYMAPYTEEEHRKPIFIWPSQIAFNGEPASSYAIKSSYGEYLPDAPVPKLMFHAKPGMIIKKKEANRIKETWSNLETIDLGKGKHYLQETHPHAIGEGIADWYTRSFMD